MQVHLYHRNVRDTVIILEEGNLPHPWCHRCNMLVSWRALKKRHLATTQCAMGEESNFQHLDEEEMQESVERASQTYRRQFETVNLFNYSGLVLMAEGDDCPALIVNLKKARKS